MLKTLLKKQFYSVLSGYGMKKKDGKKGVGGYVALLAVLILGLGVTFFSYETMICKPLADAGLGWLYFVYTGIVAILLSVVGSIFMMQSCLYEAKDNELLLSLPIPPKYILFVRMVPLYVQNLLFEAAVLVPACICWCLYAPVSAVQVIFWVITLFVQPLLSLFITCLLGFLFSLITAKMRDKTLFNVILSLIFIAAYVVLYALFYNKLGAIVSGSGAVAAAIRKYAYPIYLFGTSCMGDYLGIIVTTAIVGALFALLYVALAKTYIMLVTSKRGGKKSRYNGKVEKPVSVFRALLRKETRRFFGSGIYFLNCGLGVILLLIAAVMFIIKSGELTAALNSVGLLPALPVLVTFVIALISFMDGVSAPSISLEGKTLWLLQSSPVNLWSVLKAKLMLHYLVTAPAATVCSAVIAIMIQPNWAMTLIMLVFPSAVVMLCGVLGLIFNLKKPNLDWENETIVMKQSKSVLLTLLTGWGIFLVMAGTYFAAKLIMPAELYLLICLVLLSAMAAGLSVWLKKKGVALLMEL